MFLAEGSHYGNAWTKTIRYTAISVDNCWYACRRETSRRSYLICQSMFWFAVCLLFLVFLTIFFNILFVFNTYAMLPPFMWTFLYGITVKLSLLSSYLTPPVSLGFSASLNIQLRLHGRNDTLLQNRCFLSTVSVSDWPKRSNWPILCWKGKGRASQSLDIRQRSWAKDNTLSYKIHREWVSRKDVQIRAPQILLLQSQPYAKH